MDHQERMEFLRRQTEFAISEATVKVQTMLREQRNEVEAFPLDAFPGAVRAIIQEWKQASLLPVDYFGAGVLVAASAALGNAFAVEYKRNHREAPILFMALVGAPGLGKTPAIKLALGPLFRMEDELGAQYEEKMQSYNQEYEVADRNFRRLMEPRKPRRRELIINDATVEAVAQCLYGNPRGVLYYRDELNGWFNSMNQYRKGADGEFWLSVFSNATFKVNRVGREPLLILRPFISVIGGIQPGILPVLAAESRRDNGMLSRILLAYPFDQRIPAETNDEINPETTRRYEQILHNLLSLPNRIVPPARSDGRWFIESVAIRLSRAAHEVYREFSERIREQCNTTEDETVRGLLIKLKAYCLRFSLILEMLSLACLQKEPVALQELEKLTVSDLSMCRAVKLVRYFEGTATRALRQMENPGLTPKQHILYLSLPNVVTWDFAVQVARSVRISESTVRRMLNQSRWFRRTGHGSYEKRML